MTEDLLEGEKGRAKDLFLRICIVTAYLRSLPLPMSLAFARLYLSAGPKIGIFLAPASQVRDKREPEKVLEKALSKYINHVHANDLKGKLQARLQQRSVVVDG
jgi:hypothetical protein